MSSLYQSMYTLWPFSTRSYKNRWLVVVILLLAAPSTALRTRSVFLCLFVLALAPHSRLSLSLSLSLPHTHTHTLSLSGVCLFHRCLLFSALQSWQSVLILEFMCESFLSATLSCIHFCAHHTWVCKRTHIPNPVCTLTNISARTQYTHTQTHKHWRVCGVIACRERYH